MKKRLLLIVCILSSQHLLAQELFPYTEPASTIPKGTLSVRAFGEYYKEIDKHRIMNGLRLNYGLLSNLTVGVTATGSNHHKTKLPTEFPYHNTPERGVEKPYLMNGMSAQVKYRYLSIDKKQQHLRLATYAEGSLVNVAHDEGEPRLMDDTKGWGIGLINTYLYKRGAISLTVGGIFPGQYKGVQVDPYVGLPDIPTRVAYGKALNYSLSFGYLIYPKKYTSYKQTNINLYLELMGKSYAKSRVWIQPETMKEYEILTSYFPDALKSNTYVDIVPGIQFIFNSNTRIDVSAAFQGIGKSYAHLYPAIYFGLQHYFYLK